MKTAYNFAMKDWFHPPEIHRIEQQDRRIRVEASDEVLVSRVQVRVLNDEGNVLETGRAVRGEGDWWGIQICRYCAATWHNPMRMFIVLTCEAARWIVICSQSIAVLDKICFISDNIQKMYIIRYENEDRFITSF